MAERLTRKIGYEYEKAKRETQLLEINNKLGELEDILEKYGVESVEELDFRLAFKQNDVFNYKVVTELEQERDTWQKACELACEDLQFYDYGNEKTEDGIIMKVDYFYQQAKKESESK